MTARAGSYTDFPNGEHYEFVDQRVTEAVTSRTGSDKDISGDVGSKLFDRPVKESATAWAERDSHGPSDEYGKSYTDFSNGEHYESVDRRVTEAVTSRTGSDMDMSNDENSNLCDRPATESATEWDSQDSQDPDNEYWSNVYRQAEQAMREMTGTDANLLGDKYPDVVKELVRRTMKLLDEHDALPVEQQTGCEVPGCQCNGRVEFMVRGSEDMTETDDSDYEDSSVFDQPVTESVTAWAGSDTDLPSYEHSGFFGLPVTESVTARAGSDTNFPHGEYSEVVDRPVTE